MAKTILFINGSDRKGSFNGQFLNAIVTKVSEKGLQSTVLDFADVPFLSQNTEFPTPESVKAVREKVANADALFIVTPEYNGSYPARLKNLMDWLSRPAVAGDFATPTVLAGKKVAFASAAGSTEGKFVRSTLATYLPYIRTNPLTGEGLGIQIPAESWATGSLTDHLQAEQLAAIDKYVDEFVAFLG